MNTRFKQISLATVCLMTALAAYAQDDASAKADAVLKASKAATGGAAWDEIKTLKETGKLSGSGFAGSYSSITDLPAVLNVQDAVLGPMKQAQGWDGKAAWSSDSSGQVRIEESRQALAGEIEQTYKAAYAFYWPERYPAKRSYVGVKSADGKQYDAIDIAPEGADPFELWIDQSTHLIAREVDLTGSQPHTFLLDDYRSVAGVMLPFAERDTIGDVKYDMLASTSTLESVAALGKDAYVAPATLIEADPFPAGQDSVTIPFSLDNNHIILFASIDGEKPARFLFDTGGLAILDKAYAASIHVKETGGMAAGGFGEGVTSFGVAKVPVTEVGGFTIKDQVYFTMDLGPGVSASGIDLAGIVGYEIPKRAVMQIDYEHHLITLIRRSTFKAPAGAEAIPFKFSEHTPMIQASVDGVSGEFEFDTGARSSLTVFALFADANHMSERYHPTHKMITGYGAGGPVTASLMRVHELDIGSMVIKEPVTEIVGGERGAGASTQVSGNIGADLLRRFTVTLDYEHQLIYLQPNQAYGTPDLFDRSGLWLMKAQDGSDLIGDVVADSAAAKSGLKVGDRILAVDGVKAEAMALTDLRDRFKGPVGTRFTLRIVRDKKAPKTVTLRLQDLI